MLSFYVNMGIKCLHPLHDTRFTAAAITLIKITGLVTLFLNSVACLDKVYRFSCSNPRLILPKHTKNQKLKRCLDSPFQNMLPFHSLHDDLTKEIWVLMVCAFWNLSVYGQPLPLKCMTSPCLALAVQSFWNDLFRIEFMTFSEN